MEFHVKQLLQAGRVFLCDFVGRRNGVSKQKKRDYTPMDFISENQISAKEAADKVVGKSAGAAVFKDGRQARLRPRDSERARQKRCSTHTA